MPSLTHDDRKAERFSATAGDVVNVFLAILIGSFSLALLAPEMQGNHILSLSFRTDWLVPTQLSQMVAAPRRNYF